MCVCVSCSDEFDYIALSNFDWFKELRCQYVRYLTGTCRLFADEHSLSFSKKNSSVGVMTLKKSKFLLKKKSKCPKRGKKKKFKVWRGGRGKEKKIVRVEFRVFGKKWKKSSEKKNQSVFFGENFAKFVFTGWAYDCLLYGKKMIKFSKYFSGWGLCLTRVGAPCCKTWLKFEIEALRCREKKIKVKKWLGRG